MRAGIATVMNRALEHRSGFVRFTLAIALTLLSACRGETVSVGGDGGFHGPVLCAGMECASGQECCFTTAQCFDPSAAPDSCPRPPLPATGPVEGLPCAANSQCGPGEYCGGSLCLGAGFCMSRTNTGFCWAGRMRMPQTQIGGPIPSPGPGTECQVCGCDGITYDAIQIAGQAGARVAASGACGVGTSPVRNDGGSSAPAPIGCGSSSQCPAGSECCALTGHCIDPAEPWRCTLQPDGTLLDCRNNDDCNSFQYCLAQDGCGTPGRCSSRPSGCDGLIEAVCGCDGRSYTNACWAANAGTRVASSGECP